MKSHREQIKELKNEIEALRSLCRYVGVPEFIIRFPSVVKGKSPTKEDLKWAREKMKEYKTMIKTKINADSIK